MKKRIIKLAGACILSCTMLTSCYTYTSVVGEGAQGKGEESQANHYVVAGLVPIAVSDSKEMAGGADNYEVTTKMSFIDGLVSWLTGGIYTPTTTTVKK